MKVTPHTAREFATAIASLLPPGAAWIWPEGGLGDSMLVATGEELARVDAAVQGRLDYAIELHRPIVGSWHISKYREVALEALGGLTETMPRKMFAVGSHVGDRVWSNAGPDTTFPVDLVKIDHLVGPLRVGSHVGDRCWGTRGRYILQVRYYRSVVNPKVVWDALVAFKQSHVYLWFEDITGVGGEVNYGQD